MGAIWSVARFLAVMVGTSFLGSYFTLDAVAAGEPPAAGTGSNPITRWYNTLPLLMRIALWVTMVAVIVMVGMWLYRTVKGRNNKK